MQVVKAGLGPSWLHGAQVHGVSDTVLARQRTVAASVAGHVNGQSATMLLMMLDSPRVDPIYLATESAVKPYLCIVWQHEISFSSLERAWRAMKQAGAPECSWRRATGPIMACWLSLRRIGWGMLSPFVWHTDMNEQVVITKMAPLQVVQMLRDSIFRWQWARVAQHIPGADTESPRWLRPLRRLMSGKLSVQLVGALTCVLKLGLWPA